MNVIEYLSVARIGLGQTLHEIDELTGHTDSLKPEAFMEICCRSCSGGDPKGQPRVNVSDPFTTDDYGADTMLG